MVSELLRLCVRHPSHLNHPSHPIHPIHPIHTPAIHYMVSFSPHQDLTPSSLIYVRAISHARCKLIRYGGMDQEHRMRRDEMNVEESYDK